MRKIVCLFACLFISTANAGIITDFTAGYDVANWTQVLDGGIIDLSGAPTQIIEISSNVDMGPVPADTDFTIAALGDGNVTFDWLYTTADEDAFFDPFGYLLNGIFTQLTTDFLPTPPETPQSGTTSFAVTMGDIFGFRAASTDTQFGSASTTISNFSAPMSESVPEPSNLFLLGLGMIFLGLRRFQKR